MPRLRRTRAQKLQDHRRALPLALLATVALAAAGCGSTETKPTARATQATPTHPQQFMSRRYEFRVTLTSAWAEVDARSPWNGKQLEGVESPHFANFEDPTGRTLVAAAAPVATGTGLAAWRADMVRAAPPVCSDSRAVQRTSLGGAPALTWTARCSDGYHVHKIAALHGRRGYMVLLPSPTANGAAKDRRIFESIRRTFRFTRR